MPCEFNCTDCGDHIYQAGDDRPPYGRLCAMCLHQPGWYLDPTLVAIYDPHRVIQPVDRDPTTATKKDGP